LKTPSIHGTYTYVHIYIIQIYIPVYLFTILQETKLNIVVNIYL